MSKRITIFLSDKASQYFYLVMAGLEVPDGKGDTKPCNQSQAINHCLEELALFEEFTEDQLTNWLLTNYPEKYKAYRDALPAEMKVECSQTELTPQPTASVVADDSSIKFTSPGQVLKFREEPLTAAELLNLHNKPVAIGRMVDAEQSDKP